MYTTHFSLLTAPFSITPDSAFFYPHEGAQSALNMLLVALRSGEGFLKVVGEVGCGKTVLCRHLLNILQGECVTAYIPNPAMEPNDLLRALMQELNIQDFSSADSHNFTRFGLLNALRDCLVKHAESGRRVVLLVDEAQAISTESLESLRLLSNLETEKQKLLQLVLLGQPELDVRLSHPELRQLLQRITFSEYLGPMAALRVPGYLVHRLSTAAASEATNTGVFEIAAAQEIARLSGGVPRLVNILAHKCLMLAFGESKHHVTVRHVRFAAADTPGLGGSMHRRASSERAWGHLAYKKLITAVFGESI